MLESLGFSPVTFAVTIINIVILFFILRAILFKPLTKLMAERTKRVQDSVSQAEQDRAQAKVLLDQYEGQIKKANAEVDDILKSARETAGSEAARIVADGRAAAEALIANARIQLNAEYQAAMARFRTEAAALVMAASSKLVARQIGGEDNLRYANMLLDELASRKENN